YKGQYEFELSTMPGWAGSSWYYLRYMDPHNADRFVSEEAEQYWGQVDLYMGGAEHATGHLLYSRFWYLFLKDLGLVTANEPFQKLINQGMILGRSNFVYRLNLTYKQPDAAGQMQTIQGPLVLVSKSIYEQLSTAENPYEILKDKQGAVRTHLREFVGKLAAPLGENGSAATVEFGNPLLTPLHADVSLVDNDVLDTAAFKNWREEYADAEFVL
nr:leucine--tRNA ligase, chloroplastic/mitochondrial [Tanacetum cinerariifolium]